MSRQGYQYTLISYLLGADGRMSQVKLGIKREQAAQILKRSSDGGHARGVRVFCLDRFTWHGRQWSVLTITTTATKQRLLDEAVLQNCTPTESLLLSDSAQYYGGRYVS